MIDHSTIDEVQKMIKEINIEKVPCLDGIPIEILLYDSEIHRLISDFGWVHLSP